MPIMFTNAELLAYAKEHWYYQDGCVYSKRTKRAIGTLGNRGYIMAAYKRWRAPLHRIVYLMHFKEIPEGYMIDHINRNKLDNRIENLRLVTPQTNTENQEIPWGGELKTDRPRPRPYVARLIFRGTREHLGHFGTACGARMAYLMGRMRAFA